jgi:broad specificity phosphatase PhoE
MKTIVYLIRHGAYENPKKILHLRLPGFPLSETGKQQAASAAEFFKDKRIRAVYSSRLTRAHMTAHIIAAEHNLPVITNRKLLDIRSPLQGKPLAFINAINSDFYNMRYIRAGGERLETAFKRMDQCLRTVARRHSGQSVVVVSHGDPIMTIWTRYRGLPLPKNYPFTEWYVPQASGFTIEFKAGNPVHVTRLPVHK